MSRATLSAWPVLPQLLRYGAVGLAVNFLGYVVYLVVTLWLEPKLAVTVLYPVGVLMGYFGHARYSFRFAGHRGRALARYIGAYVAGYLVNEMLLYVFTDRLGLPHQAVQAAAIFVVAGILFLLLRFFVFPAKPVAP